MPGTVSHSSDCGPTQTSCCWLCTAKEGEPGSLQRCEVRHLPWDEGDRIPSCVRTPAGYGVVPVGFAVCPLLSGIVCVDETGVTLAEVT